MALKKPKKKKYPKNPGKGGTIKQKQDYLDKTKAIDKEYEQAMSEWKKQKELSDKLDKQISGIGKTKRK